MAKAKQQKQLQQQKQKLLVIYLTICFVVSLLIEVDSVSASSIQLDGNGNMLQQQQQQQRQQLAQQPIDNNLQEHNYIMDPAKQRLTSTVTQNPNIFDDSDDEYDDNANSKANTFNENLTRNQLSFGHPMAMVKRAPSGFVGMRGKKLYYDVDDDDDDNNENNNDITSNLPWNQLQNSVEEPSWEEYAKTNVRRYKKAPTVFYGVRGKKFVTMNGGGSPNNDNHRWQDFLQKLEEERIRDAILQDFVERLAGTKNGLPNEMTKRAPTGFTGVRGKRPSVNELDSSFESLTKRGLGNNAFVGVRGKKDVSHQEFKRSPLEAESLPGGSGQRQRFVDLNNKFVAVRGKKSSYADMQTFNSINNSKSPSATVSLLNGKRTRNGFLGTRGKRPFNNDDEI